MINLRTHNILDYSLGVLLIFIPEILGLRQLAAMRHFFVIAGVCLIVYSLLTDYIFSAFRLIGVKAHFHLDTALGIIILLGPTLIGYRTALSGGQLLANVILGLVPIGMAALTSDPELDLGTEESEIASEPPKEPPKNESPRKAA